MDTRKHRRVRMHLPVRLRWTTPFGQRIELGGQTMDVSRSGLLVSTTEPHTPGTTLWVTFPYDASLPDGQPEMVARVTRCDEVPEPVLAGSEREKFQMKNAPERKRSAKSNQLALPFSDSSASFAVAVHFELPAQANAGSNGDKHRGEFERRRNPRRALTVPVRVRPADIPWFEEAMTIDYSVTSIRFRSNREYRPGDRLKIAFYGSALAPWRGKGEFLSEVVRVAPVAGSIALDVSVRRVK
jgi:hypothetical protein